MDGRNSRSAELGLIYDLLARQTWSEKAAANLHGFCIETAARELDSAILRLASNEFDRQKTAARASAEAQLFKIASRMLWALFVVLR